MPCVAVIAVPVALLHKVQPRLNVVLSITVEQRFRDPTAFGRLACTSKGVHNVIVVVTFKIASALDIIRIRCETYQRWTKDCHRNI
jgi:hypothetical protein